MRENIALQCSECKSRNYITEKETKGAGKIELKKHCRFCRKHTLHVEKKKK